MASIHVEAARTVDRDGLLALLSEHGFEATPSGDELGIEVRCGDDVGRACAEVVSDLEQWIADAGLPLVPELVDGGVYLRPPGS